MSHFDTMTQEELIAYIKKTNKTSNPSPLLCDYYKLGHYDQYPEGTETIYSTFIPRSNKYYPAANEVVVFGIQAFVKKYLIDHFNTHFFSRPKAEVVEEYVRFVTNTLGVKNPRINHIEELHDLGYLPVKLKALKEGTLAPIKVPVLTVVNTRPDMAATFWITNYLETLISNEVWLPMTSATIAHTYRKLLDKYALETVGTTEGVPYQGHDFSMRGMASLDASKASGAGHLLSFVGTDTIPAIFHLEEFYNANVEKELVGTSISATEHSVMCSYGQTDEFELFKHLMTNVYPTGFFSVVSDTWDFWKVVGEYLPALKETILNRDGRVVIRPDSGDPVDIVCGTPDGKTELERKGLIEALWDIFGGTVSKQGYKVLDTHIGAIYGDSMNLERITQICEKLKAKGFASTNIVFGIGLTYGPVA
ncbi:nicotinate phosphoribosyltransferase [Priestia megaterium]|uniref:nicotinate phosphoribosyltransferase n=1 Tax=Priestia megaterium TaxID=1404 RepID=UPI00211D7BBE|nr:nicotinate phosphoribosyltransferase [Priestia megaterium]